MMKTRLPSSSPLVCTARLAALVALTGVAAAHLAACGDPLVDGRYRGEPLFTLSGTVVADESIAWEDWEAWEEGEVRIGLEWAEWEGEGERGGYDVEELEITTSFPAQFEVHIYQPPSLDALFWTPWLPGHEVAVARPLLYLDRDGDSRWDLDEDEVLGGTFDTVLVYVEPEWHDGEQAEWGEPATGSDDARWDEDPWEDEPYAELGLELHYGYQRMYDLSGLCEVAPEDWETEYGETWEAEDWFPDADEPVVLYVGETEDELYFDWECDGLED